MTGGAIQNAYSNLQLDDVGIWNYALSVDEIQDLADGVSPIETDFEIVEAVRERLVSSD